MRMEKRMNRESYIGRKVDDEKKEKTQASVECKEKAYVGRRTY